MLGGQADVTLGAPYAQIQETGAPIRLICQLQTARFFAIVDAEAYPDWQALDGEPFTVHSRGSTTEAMALLVQQEEDIEFSEISYVTGAEVRATALIQGNVAATFLDIPSWNFVQEEAPDQFHELPLPDVQATDEAFVASTEWLENPEAAQVLLEETLNTWNAIIEDPNFVVEERDRLGLAEDLEPELEEQIVPYYTQAAEEGVFTTDCGGEEAARTDFEFYGLVGQVEGDPATLAVEDFWDLAPSEAALENAGELTCSQEDGPVTGSGLAAPAAGAAGRRGLWGGLSHGTRVTLLRVGSIVAVLALWELGGRIPISFTFPSFTATIAAFGEMLADGTFARAYSETIGPLLVGITLTAIGGVALGVAMGLSPRTEWFGIPVVVILQAAPSAAIIPLITYIYGIDFAAKVFAVVLLSMPVIVLNSYRGIRNTPVYLVEMSQAFLASRRQRIAMVILPAASGLIFAGLRLGLAQGFTGAILAELLITPTGVGDLITYYRSQAEYASMYAAILSIIVVASVTITLLQRLELRLFRPELRAS